MRWSGRQLTLGLLVALLCVVIAGTAAATLLGRHQAQQTFATSLSSLSAADTVQPADTVQAQIGGSTAGGSVAVTGASTPIAGSAQTPPPLSAVATGASALTGHAGRQTVPSAVAPAVGPTPRTTSDPTPRAPTAQSVPAHAAPAPDASSANGLSTGHSSAPPPPGPAPHTTARRTSPAPSAADGEAFLQPAPAVTASPQSAGTVPVSADPVPPSQEALAATTSRGPSTNLTVQLTDATRDDPVAPSAQAALQSYFDAINAHDYQAWAESVSGAMAASRDQAEWMVGYSTTTDSSIVLDAISAGGMSARVQFTSVQELAQAPADLRSGCINWTLTYRLVTEGDRLVIAGTVGSESHTSCG